MRKTKQGIKPIDQPDFTYSQALYMAFYSSRLYIDVVKRWHGFGIGYFILLIAIISIPWSINYTQQLVRYFDEELIFPIAHMPLLMIQNGEASVDKPMPYFVKSKTGDNIIEIDTTTDVKAFPEKSPTLIVLITKNNIYYRATQLPIFSKLEIPADEKISTYTFDKNTNDIFSGREWVNNSKVVSLKLYAALFVYPIVLGGFLGLYTIYNIILSSIGRIISSVVLKYKITFQQSFRLAWVASTAPLFFVTVLQFLGVNLTGTGPYYIALVACYFAFAVIAVKRESQTMVRW